MQGYQLRVVFRPLCLRATELVALISDDATRAGLLLASDRLLFYTNNGGGAWTRVSMDSMCQSETLRDICMDWATGLGMVVGDGGAACSTRDGGLTWQVLSRSTVQESCLAYPRRSVFSVYIVLEFNVHTVVMPTLLSFQVLLARACRHVCVYRFFRSSL